MSGSSPEGPGSIVGPEVGARQKNSRRRGRWSSGYRSISSAGGIWEECAVSRRLHWSFVSITPGSRSVGHYGHTWSHVFSRAQKDKYLRRCDVDGMRQKGERLKKLVRLLPQGRVDLEAPFCEDGRGECAQGRQTMLDPFVPFRIERLPRCRNPNLWAIWSFR